MNTIDYIMILVGIFLLYVAILLLRQRSNVIIGWLLVFGAGTCLAYPFFDRSIITDKQLGEEPLKNPAATMEPPQSAVIAAQEPDELFENESVEVPESTFKGSPEEAKYQANRWYEKAVKLWDVSGVQYRLPDSVLSYIDSALFYLQFSEAYNVRGQVLVQKGEISKAVKNYSIAIKLNPEQAQPFFNRGTAYYIMQEMDEACKDWKKAQQLGLPNASMAIATYCR